MVHTHSEKPHHQHHGETPGSAPRAGEVSHSDAVARAAYLLYLERGAQHGSDVQDWLAAEARVQAAAMAAAAPAAKVKAKAKAKSKAKPKTRTMRMAG